jgi:ABC-type transport system substrate-binding protein
VPLDKPVTIYAMTGFPMPEQAAEILQAGLRKIGITANIVAETWPTLADKCRNPDTAPDIKNRRRLANSAARPRDRNDLAFDARHAVLPS